jgi:hypothetical protein
MNADIRGSNTVAQRFDHYEGAKDAVSDKIASMVKHRDRSPEPNLRISAFIRGSFSFAFFGFFCGYSGP